MAGNHVVHFFFPEKGLKTPRFPVTGVMAHPPPLPPHHCCSCFSAHVQAPADAPVPPLSSSACGAPPLLERRRLCCSRVIFPTSVRRCTLIGKSQVWSFSLHCGRTLCLNCMIWIQYYSNNCMINSTLKIISLSFLIFCFSDLLLHGLFLSL